MVDNCANFLKVMEDLKFYVVEFQEDGTIKPKVYPDDCRIEGPNWRPIIIIIYDKYIFSANNDVW